MRHADRPTCVAVVPAAVSADQGPACAGLDAAEWQPGEAIPSEMELAARFGVSQGTVRKAIDALAADNLVVRRQGKGTFVATHTEEKTSMFRFLRIRRNDGRDEYPASRLLDVRRGKASVEVARVLELKPGRRGASSCAACSNTAASRRCSTRSTLPAALFKGLTRAQARGLPRLDVRLLRDAVRRAHAAGAGKAVGGRRRRAAAAILKVQHRRAAARGRARDVHLWRPPGRVAARAVQPRAITTTLNELG